MEDFTQQTEATAKKKVPARARGGATKTKRAKGLAAQTPERRKEIASQGGHAKAAQSIPEPTTLLYVAVDNGNGLMCLGISDTPADTVSRINQIGTAVFHSPSSYWQLTCTLERTAEQAATMLQAYEVFQLAQLDGSRFYSLAPAVIDRLIALGAKPVESPRPAPVAPRVAPELDLPFNPLRGDVRTASQAEQAAKQQAWQADARQQTQMPEHLMVCAGCGQKVLAGQPCPVCAAATEGINSRSPEYGGSRLITDSMGRVIGQEPHTIPQVQRRNVGNPPAARPYAATETCGQCGRIPQLHSSVAASAPIVDHAFMVKEYAVGDE